MLIDRIIIHNPTYIRYQYLTSWNQCYVISLKIDFCKSCSCYACLNGGICVERNGKPSCNCPSGFEGSHCHQKIVGGKIVLFMNSLVI